ncbi:MAG: class I tRNA ligase family protein, partial [Patescibacteria group bacterium]
MVEKSPRAKKEEEILKFWKENKIFEKSLEKGDKEFVFYDGPPFATGLPHYGHILPGTIKDVIPRYKTMRGFRVPRRWGWDCHGLPIENLIEKELGLETKKDIEKFGIGEFNRRARESVLRYEKEWKEIIPRTGRWIDMDNAYKTMDTSYTESVWWSFKELYDKELVSQGFKVMHLCPHCETTLSNFEVNQGYKDITDISVTVELEDIEKPNTYFLAWTTTPWTLPGNVALAINPEIEYAEVEGEVAGNTYILAHSRVEKVFGE